MYVDLKLYLFVYIYVYLVKQMLDLNIERLARFYI